MPTQTLIEPTQAAAASGPVTINREQLPLTLIATGLAGSDVITVNFSVDGGSNVTPAQQDGGPVQLTASNNVLAVRSPLVISVSKVDTSSEPSTAGAFLSSGVDSERAV